MVYTWPGSRKRGYTEQQLKDKNIEYKSGSFPFKASGRARASMDTDGFIKVLADKSNDEILGVHMIGPRAADMIAEGRSSYGIQSQCGRYCQNLSCSSYIYRGFERSSIGSN